MRLITGKRKPNPIDARPERHQTLAVTLTAAAAYLPLAPHLAWQVSVFCALMLGLRLAALRWPAATPGTWSLLALTLVGVLNCVLINHSLVGKVGGTALLVTMLAVKLLELRDRRDHRIVAIVLGLLIVVQFLFGQGIGLTLFLGLVAIMVVALLVDLNGGLGTAPLHRTVRVTVQVVLQAVPLTLVLFLLFPRLSTPLWSLGLERDRGTMGMSETMEPGSVSELVVNGELAFRARFQQPPPAPARLYWRGLVLWEVDDRRWSPGRDPPHWMVGPQPSLAEELLDYEVVLEASQQRWLFALDLPVAYPADTILGPAFTLTATTALTTAKRYRARSALRYRTADPPAAERQYALRLPSSVSGRERALVAEWGRTADSDWDLVQSGLAYFAREDFHYTLVPPRLGANTWDEFLFVTRSGFCEHYAGSFALLMRIAGVPSRVVLGYLGGEPNRIGGYHMIWQSDAHAWVEVAIEGRGWVRVDPTSAVAPSRIDNQGASRLLGAAAPLRFQVDPQGAFGRTIRQLRNLADSLDAVWQETVLDFSSDRQDQFLDELGLRDYGQFALAAMMVSSGSLVMGLVLFALMRQAQPMDPGTRDYSHFCARLAAIGLTRAASEGPRDFGRRVVAARPDLAAQVGRILSLYVSGRYMAKRGNRDQERLAQEVRRFHPRRRRAS
ncbi:DUF3488 and transglutaminase-like domain-containing protein [uncultured Thiodictyon sp.]|jgi:transglutaminase-like putative cysteine protease|uniref:transglutaminase TgpA family protein n=1 Tax=uncultured Thiodictyon sp. TaxID=1846217 RepID=UPI0025E616C5|nr:DUF3488 and transglutaminase-like domain-containing protein [uncultured Thiodictyon sp.]